MIGNILRTAVKTVILPVDIAVDVANVLEDRNKMGRTSRRINSIADELDEIL